MNQRVSIHEWLTQARSELTAVRPEEPSSSLYAILEKHTGTSRSWLLAHQEAYLEKKPLLGMNSDLQDLKNGKPLAYLLGKWEFYGLAFFVSPAVLIPRPETELLVETALDILAPNQQAQWIADIGTGSGCIAITLAYIRPNIHALATDLSLAALEIANLNINQHGLAERIHLLQCDLLNGVQTHFDLICANLPYIPSSTLQHLTELHYEPTTALDGGKDGLELFRKLLQQVRENLAEHGSILLEMQFDQANMLHQIVYAQFPDAEISVKRDLSNHDRLLVIQT